MTGGAMFVPGGGGDDGSAFEDGGGHDVQWVGTPSIRGPKWAKVPFLTMGMLGIQCVWSIEMGYASPYLLELGLSKSWMSLVFMAGPLSGLIVQPLIGVIADRSKSRWGRRRPFMLAGAALCAFAMMVLGWTRELSGFFGLGSWMAIFLAVFAIYLIDFSINAVMSTDRALVVDTLPNNRQDEGSAWAGRMFGFGSLAGFFVGNLDLPPLLPFLGKTQIQILSFVTSGILMTCHFLTSWAVTERVLLRDDRPSANNGLFASLKAIWDNIFSLPPGLRMVCFIDFFASLGWFPVLFFTTVWVSDVYKSSMEQGDMSDAAFESAAVRAGARSLFFQAIVTITIGLGLPPFVNESGINLEDDGYQALNGGIGMQPTSAIRKRHREMDDNASVIQKTVKWARGVLRKVKDASRDGSRLLPIPGFTLIRAWWISQLMFACCMAATWWVTTVTGAYVVIGLTGISWGLFQWAPYALIGELILIDGQIDRNKEEIIFMRTSAETAGGLSRTASRAHSPPPVAPSFTATVATASAPSSGHHTPVHSRVHSRTSLTLQRMMDDETRPRKSADVPREYGATDGAAAENGLTPLIINAPQIEDPSTVIVRHSSFDSERSSVDMDGVDPGASSFTSRTTMSEKKGMADKAGIILGIHNVFMVLPQFLVTILSSAIFYLMEPDKSLPEHHPQAPPPPVINGTLSSGSETDAVATGVEIVGRLLARNGGAVSGGSPNAVGLIFRIGGASAAVGAYLCWRLSRRWAKGEGI